MKIGDKVVYIGASKYGFVKDNIYIIQETKYRCDNNLLISVGVKIPNGHVHNCSKCGENISKICLFILEHNFRLIE